MKWIFICACLLLIVPRSLAAASYVQNCTGVVAASSPTSCTFGVATGTGNSIHCLFSNSSGGLTVSPPTDNGSGGSNTYDQVPSSTDGLVYQFRTTTGHSATTVTVTWTGGATRGYFGCAEYSGENASSENGASFQGILTQNTFNAGNVTTTGTDILICLVSDYTTNGSTISITATGSWNVRETLNDAGGPEKHLFADRLNVSPGTYTCSGTISSSDQNDASIAAFTTVTQQGGTSIQ